MALEHWMAPPQATAMVPGQIYPPPQTLTPMEAPPSPGPNPIRNPDDPPRNVLVNARNRFNELSPKVMLWTIHHILPSGSQMVFNCYYHLVIWLNMLLLVNSAFC